MGRIRQIARAYKLTHEYDKQLPFWIVGAFLVPIAVGLVISIFWHHPLYLAFLGLTTGLMFAMLILVRRAKAATYRRYAGQAGSAEVALQMLPKAWISTPVIAANRNRDVVHRTVGPGGLVLIGEGEPGRVRQLLASEVKKHERVAYGITVTTIVMGESRVRSRWPNWPTTSRSCRRRCRPTRSPTCQRLRALDAVRPRCRCPRARCRPAPDRSKAPGRPCAAAEPVGWPNGPGRAHHDVDRRADRGSAA